MQKAPGVTSQDLNLILCDSRRKVIHWQQTANTYFLGLHCVYTNIFSCQHLKIEGFHVKIWCFCLKKKIMQGSGNCEPTFPWATVCGCSALASHLSPQYSLLPYPGLLQSLTLSTWLPRGSEISASALKPVLLLQH